MAVYTAKGAILHERYKTPGSKIVGVGIDIEHAFNGTWKELVLARAKDTHKIQKTIWNISRHMLNTVTYQVDVHGHLTDQQAQQTGMPRTNKIAQVCDHRPRDAVDQTWVVSAAAAVNARAQRWLRTEQAVR